MAISKQRQSFVTLFILLSLLGVSRQTKSVKCVVKVSWEISDYKFVEYKHETEPDKSGEYCMVCIKVILPKGGHECWELDNSDVNKKTPNKENQVNLDLKLVVVPDNKSFYLLVDEKFCLFYKVSKDKYSLIQSLKSEERFFLDEKVMKPTGLMVIKESKQVPESLVIRYKNPDDENKLTTVNFSTDKSSKAETSSAFADLSWKLPGKGPVKLSLDSFEKIDSNYSKSFLSLRPSCGIDFTYKVVGIKAEFMGGRRQMLV